MSDQGSQPPSGDPASGGDRPSGELRFTSMRRHRQGRRSGRLIGGAIVAVLLIAGGIWYWMQREPDPDPVTPVATDPQPAPEQPDAQVMDLPELDASDEVIRRLVAGLSQHPQWASWMVTDELVRRFVRVVIDLAGNQNPANELEFMAPQQEFSVAQVDGRLVVAPESYRRYDLVAATFASLDVEGSVQLYREIRPLIDEAFEELGVPDQTFDQALAAAIRNVLAVEFPEGPLEVEQVEAVYEFRDPALESQRGAVKALLRFGPQNLNLVQSQTEAFARALGVSY